MQKVLWSLVLLYAVVALGCGSDAGDSCETGEERCTCYDDGTCNGALSCKSDRCVDLGVAGSSGSSGNAGSGGSGGGSGASSGTVGSGGSGIGSSGTGGSGGAGGTGGTGNGGTNGGSTDNNDETVTHNTTGLTWMRCPAGESGSECDQGRTNKYDWREANDYCDKLGFADHDDWRLPSRQDYIDMLGDCDSDVFVESNGWCNSCYRSTTCSELFGVDGDRYWSSSSGPGDAVGAWSADFSEGGVFYRFKTEDLAVRCVRGEP